MFVCISGAGAAESEYGVDAEVISCDSVLDAAQPISSDADMSSRLVGKITFVQCSAGSAKSVADVSADAVPGVY